MKVLLLEVPAHVLRNSGNGPGRAAIDVALTCLSAFSNKFRVHPLAVQLRHSSVWEIASQQPTLQSPQETVNLTSCPSSQCAGPCRTETPTSSQLAAGWDFCMHASVEQWPGRRRSLVTSPEALKFANAPPRAGLSLALLTLRFPASQGLNGIQRLQNPAKDGLT